jgi:hypothetical protein
LFLSLKESRAWIVLCILVAASSRIVVRRLVEEKVKKKMQEWATANPLPSQPELLEFYDPRATLTDRDRAVLRVLDYWPGYPPFWKFLRQQVLNRDGKRCQITGCPNRLEPHVHHKTPLAKGGSHKPENLVTLCEYHHAMQDDMGHNRIRGQVVTPYFTYVQPYQRSDGVEVRGHLRHKKFATEDEISRIVTFYGIVCLLCGGILEAAVEEYRVVVRCLSQCCEDETKYRLSIPEEVGPAICLECRATRNLSAEDVYWRSYVSGKRMWGAPHSSKKHGASLREVDSDIAQEFKRVVSCPNPSCRKQMHVPTAGNPTMRCPHCKREFRAREITSSGMNPDEE